MEYSAGTFIMQQSWHFEWKLLSPAGGQSPDIAYQRLETQTALQVGHATILLPGHLNFYLWPVFATPTLLHPARGMNPKLMEKWICAQQIEYLFKLERRYFKRKEADSLYIA